ncbi:MAG: hypothetical protein ACOZBL_06165 [Patescibacteria group bacterium]
MKIVNSNFFVAKMVKLYVIFGVKRQETNRARGLVPGVSSI